MATQTVPKRASARSISVGGHTSVTASVGGGEDGGRDRPPVVVPLAVLPRGRGTRGGRPITPRGACLLAMPPDVMWDTERATHHWSARLTDEEARRRYNNARLQFAIKLSDSRIDAFMLAGYIPESIEAFDPCTEGHHQLWGGRAALPTLHLKRAAWSSYAMHLVARLLSTGTDWSSSLLARHPSHSGFGEEEEEGDRCLCLTERTTANGHLRRMSSHERCSGGGDELQICRVQCPCGKQGEEGKTSGAGGGQG